MTNRDSGYIFMLRFQPSLKLRPAGRDLKIGEKMPRRKIARRIGFQPGVTYFKPRGVVLADLVEVILTLDELEALRLADAEGVEQTEAAKRMNISQSTIQRILATARRKVAGALVKGQAIKLEGGEVEMARGRGWSRGLGLGRGAGFGRGRLGGQFAAGPGGVCVCTNPDCRYEATHAAGVPCYQQKCPKCGSPMVRKSE